MVNYNKKWRAKNPQKARAHSMVQEAVRSGLLVPQPCEVCGKEKAHGHHDDYSKPLTVRWLCSLHHRQFHNPPLKNVVIKIKKKTKKALLSQKAVAMHEDGKSYTEIAAELGCSRGTAYKWVNKDCGYH